MARSRPTLKDIYAARERIGDSLRFTSLVPAILTQKSRREVWLKLENTQKTGSFKERGALNKLLILKDAGKHRGIVAASAGNHARAVSFHGRRLGFDVTIVMPTFAPLTKIAACQRNGANVMLVGETFDEAVDVARSLAKQKKLAFLHAFDDPDIIAGQGTCGLEILEQCPNVDQVVISVGGGGLASGIALAVKSNRPKCKIIGVQAEAYPQVTLAYKGLQHRPRNWMPKPTIGDGIAIKGIGEATLPILKKYLDRMVLVSEEEMANGVLFLLESSKVLAEGGGAAAFAALMAGKVKVTENTVVLISGGNIDVTLIARIIEKGLVKTDRLLRLSVVISDRPGGLNKLSGILAEAKANILQIQHERSSEQIALYDTGTELTLETRGAEHISEILDTLRTHGYLVKTRS